MPKAANRRPTHECAAPEIPGWRRVTATADVVSDIFHVKIDKGDSNLEVNQVQLAGHAAHSVFVSPPSHALV